MWGRLGPRFALEAGFLILLAVGLGLADKDWVVILAVMGAGWVLVSLIELIASRRPPWSYDARAAVPPPVAPPVEPPLEPAPEPPPPEPEPAAAAEVSDDTQEVEREEDLVEPAKPGRRWFGLRRAKVEAPSDERVDGIPEPPKHVRRLDGEEDEREAARTGAEGGDQG
jgi:hypothetical protein